MDAYRQFARVYDQFMQDTPYDAWIGYIRRIWAAEGLAPALVLDLACGTGGVTIPLAQAGYDMIGLDLSEEMLMMAREKSWDLELDILYICQDMAAFELYGTVDAAICLCDSVNYLTEEGQLESMLALFHHYLNPGGLFIFDINTPYKYEHILGDHTYADIGDDAAYIWENEYDPKERLNSYGTTFFIRSHEDGRYERFDELHIQRAYSIDEVSAAIAWAGLTLLHVYDELTLDPPQPESQRVFFVVRRDR